MNRRGPLPGLRAGLLALACSAGLGLALSPAQASQPSAPPIELVTVPPSQQESGLEIYQRFRDGLAEPQCDAAATGPRWKKHFAHAPSQLVKSDDVLPLFGYVVDALREAHLPTEFALIPFVESGYKPGARSAQGPAGLWQMIAVTARNHKVPIRAGYDGRLSPVDSTAAAVRYLKTLHGMFAGDWRLAVMAYNAGEYRVLGALKRSGQVARDAKPEALPGLSPITHAYVRKLHALSCLLEQADDREEWLRALDRPVPLLEAVTLPDDTVNIAAWARRNGQDPIQLQRLNPAFAGGRITRTEGKPARLLAVAPSAESSDNPAVGGVGVALAASIPATQLATTDGSPPSPATATDAAPPESTDSTSSPPRRHTVVRGDNPWKIAAHYGVRVADLLQRNGLDARSVLKPGKVLLVDADVIAGDVTGTAGTP